MGIVSLLMLSCKGEKATGEPEEEASEVDSMELVMADTLAEDTMEQLIEATPMPLAAEELFDDFFFNFAANKKLQISRIKFPLFVIRGERRDTLNKEDWRHDRFFMRQGYYTLIFEDESQMDIPQDTSVDKVVVERIYYGTESVERNYFVRSEGIWRLEEIEYEPISANRNSSFLVFYERFASDSLFQTESLAETVVFTGPDPDDDFGEMEGLLTAETWPAFAPELPQGVIYNMVYGDGYGKGNDRIFMIRGISNGLEMRLDFAQTGDGRWILTRFSE